MSTKDLKNAIKEYYVAKEAQDWDTLNNYIADNHTFYMEMGEATSMDREGHIGMMKMVDEAFTDGKYQLDLIITEGDHVVVNGRWTGKHTGTFNEIPASGNDINFAFTNIFRFENDQIVEERAIIDSLSLMTQMGAIPAPNPAEN